MKKLTTKSDRVIHHFPIANKCLKEASVKNNSGARLLRFALTFWEAMISVRNTQITKLTD